MTRLRIALPNKGRLSESALTLLRKAGLHARMRNDRSLMAPLGNGYRAIFLRAADIPELVADGAAEVGVTGADLIAESGREVRELLDLEFGPCRLVVAVEDESNIHCVADIPAGTRVATAFPRLTRSYFESQGIPVEIATVSGAAEVAPHLGVAEIIVDLTSTGSTLRVNAAGGGNRPGVHRPADRERARPGSDRLQGPDFRALPGARVGSSRAREGGI